MLFRLLKNASKWVYKVLFDNKIADNEARMILGDTYDDRNKG